ncbi:hypothetical protein RHGRI_028213 [Rhododendron griersonianum]|uniref:Uncharacterized protein n=1 Tax=Rhododendron griersonianum TaxID=479676 RepID=A0AAV6IEZ3_9ERIC|nr:hypothetical protein RHGRI_028213 [Rhododendron griersonianum]
MRSLMSHLRPKRLYAKSNNSSFLYFFSSASSLACTRTSSPTSNPSISNFLIETLAFSEPQAISISNRFPPRKSLERPHSVVQFLKQRGFSDAHIRSSIRHMPKIIFSDVDKTLKPKLQFLQDLGLTGPDLGNFISTHSRVLLYSLERTLMPYFGIIKKTLVNDDENNQGLIRLSMLLKREPWLFFIPETALRDKVSRVLDMGFSVDSRMLVHAMLTVSGMTPETFSRKIELLRSFGFSMDECMAIFRMAPALLMTSEDKLKFKIDFFLNDFKLDRRALVSWPNSLVYNIEKRVIPRCRVLRVITSKGLLLQKEPRFTRATVWILDSSMEEKSGVLRSLLFFGRPDQLCCNAALWV